MPHATNSPLSSNTSEQLPAETTTPSAPAETTPPAADANLQDVVPDMNFRRYLNTKHLGRADSPETPISAAEMAMVKDIGKESSTGNRSETVRDENGQTHSPCGPGCWIALKPNLEGLQYATNLEVLNIRHVSQLPEFHTTLPYLRLINFSGSYISDYSTLEAEKFPALRALIIESRVDGAYPPHLDTFTQLEALTPNVLGVGEMPNEITQLDKLKYLRYGDESQVYGPENIGNMKSLEYLCLSGPYDLESAYAKLITLPDSIAELDNLKVLDIVGNDHLTSLPPTLLDLESLEWLMVFGGAVLDNDPVRQQLKDRGVIVI